MSRFGKPLADLSWRSNNLAERLVDKLESRALKWGDFTLASGLKSSYYIDVKKTMFEGETTAIIGHMLCEAVDDLKIDAAGGLETGAISLATTFAVWKHAYLGQNVDGFYIRKQPKDHGSMNLIEGVLEPGMHVVILDDVLTTGGSAIKAIDAVEKAGAIVEAVVCVLDRQQGAATALYNIAPSVKYRPLITLDELISPDVLGKS